jgi:sodium/proline symporter
MLTGAIVVLVWKQYGWFGLYEMVPGFVLATLAIVVVSLLGAAPAAAVGERFARVREECAAAGC